MVLEVFAMYFDNVIVMYEAALREPRCREVFMAC
jgi:hypothetical protein